MIAQQIEGVGDGLQRIIDFVGDDAGHAAHRGELFGLAQRFLRLDLSGDVALDFKNGIAFAVEDLAGGDDRIRGRRGNGR